MVTLPCVSVCSPVKKISPRHSTLVRQLPITRLCYMYCRGRKTSWPAGQEQKCGGAVHEATLLALDATLAHQQLVWTHGSRLAKLAWTAQWYQQVLAQPAANTVSASNSLLRILPCRFDHALLIREYREQI
jgi:hypothetical protein